MLTSLADDGTVGALMYVGFVLAGIGIGIMSAQQNNVVALALNERDASQSGGIQTTMRNVGQAIGVAAIGSVLLFGITANINQAMVSSADVSPEVAQAVSEKSVTLMSDASFLDAISDIDMTDEEQQELLTVNAKARVDATRTAFIVSAVIVLLALVTTPMITKLRKEDDEQVSATSAFQNEGDRDEAQSVA